MARSRYYLSASRTSRSGRRAMHKMQKRNEKTLAMKVTAASLVFTMLLFFINLPVAQAYFAARNPVESAGLNFTIIGGTDVENQSIPAEIHFPSPYLLAELPVGENTGKTLTGKSLNRDNETASPPRAQTVQAEITILDEGFDVNDIFIPSVKLHHEGKITFALNGQVTGNVLQIFFDLNRIRSWFEEVSPLPDEVSLAVSGEGYREETVFFFRGETTIPFQGSTAVSDNENQAQLLIEGESLLLIPSEGGVLASRYTVAGSGGLSIDAVAWSLDESVEGVWVEEDGTLMVSADASPGKVTLLAAATVEVENAEGKKVPEVLTAGKTITLEYPAPAALALSGAPACITIPGPGGGAVQYALTVMVLDQKGNRLEQLPEEDIRWYLEGEAAGVALDEGGLLTVTGEAVEGTMTVIAASGELSGRLQVRLLASESGEAGKANGEPGADDEFPILPEANPPSREEEEAAENDGDEDGDDSGDDTGNDDTGEDDTGNDDTGEDDTGEEDTGEEDTGGNEGEGDAQTGGGEEAGNGEEDKPSEETGHVAGGGEPDGETGGDVAGVLTAKYCGGLDEETVHFLHRIKELLNESTHRSPAPERVEGRKSDEV